MANDAESDWGDERRRERVKVSRKGEAKLLVREIGLGWSRRDEFHRPIELVDDGVEERKEGYDRRRRIITAAACACHREAAACHELRRW